MAAILNRREFIKVAGAGAAAMALAPRLLQAAQAGRKPNFIVVFTDDQGYADVNCFGGKDLATPNLDRMAAEGMRFTDFYVAAPVCSASRASLMTGCYCERVGGLGALMPDSSKDPSLGKDGLHPDERTVAELLKQQGYATACIGKWHLGHRPEFLPTRQGFDYYFGLPYSNDMGPEAAPWAKQMGSPPLPLMENEKTIETNPDQAQLTKRYTEKAVEFIGSNKDKPFFLYLPHTMPHWPVAASEKFRGKSRAGRYGDAVEEIDWSVGEILAAVKKHGLDRDTLVVFTSDNGPWLLKDNEHGSALPLRDGKWSLYEGGMREPCIMRWPGRVPEGAVCSEVATTMDFLPTFTLLAGGSVPGDRLIDGRNIADLITGKPGAKSPHAAFFYGGSAVRAGDWKLHMPRNDDIHHVQVAPGKFRKQTGKSPLQLYNLKDDIGESKNVADQNPEVVDRLIQLIEDHNKDLSVNSRPAGRAQ